MQTKLETGIPIVTEVMDPRMIETVGEVADVFQLGTSNFQNYSLLDELGRCNTPVKRTHKYSSNIRSKPLNRVQKFC